MKEDPHSEPEKARAEAELAHQVDRISDRLGARVDRCSGVRSFAIGSYRTRQGFEFEVFIDPWSPRLARKVERKARPTPVVVKPLDMTGTSEDRHGPSDRHRQAIESAAARIGPDRRRLTDQQATQIVVSEFSACGIDVRTRAAASIARQLLHPWWPFRHPVRARREGWNWRWRRN